MKNIACLSIGCNGTAGHYSLLKSIVKEFSKRNNFNMFVFAENDIFFKEFDITFEKLIKQNVNSTIAGCLKYKDANNLFKRIQEHQIDLIIVSTFFDKDLMLKIRRSGIKTILINYPLRDTHKHSFLLKKYYKCFDSIYTLKGITRIKKLFPNEHILSPIKPKIVNKIYFKKTINNILITCGGGGLKSSTIFFNIIDFLIKELPKDDFHFNIIRGNAIYQPHFQNNVNVIKWSKEFFNLINKNDLIISEAGYFTLLDLIQTKTPAILIPGKRGIDNQELRAVMFELLVAGKLHFPFQEKKNLKKVVLEVLNDPFQIGKFIESKNKISNAIFGGKNIITELLKELE